MISVCQNDHLNMIQNIEMIVRSDRVFEDVYDKDSSDVLKWTDYFTNRADIPQMFERTTKLISSRKFLHAEVVGAFWHYFSSLAPQVMSIASAKVDNNLMRHYIVQIIFEELGTRNHRLIHSDLFIDAIESIGVTSQRRLGLTEKFLARLGFESLIDTMNDAKTNSEILGILLGLEINANENIQTVLSSLAFNNDALEKLMATPFFKIHRIAEDEHIRLDVANFLRFCRAEDEKANFIQGFDKALRFWKDYWNAISDIIEMETLP